MQKVVQSKQHRKFWELVGKLKDGRFDIPGLNVEKLHGKTGKLFSARMSKEMRLIFSMQQDVASKSLIIHEINHHDEAYERAERSDAVPRKLELANETLTAETIAEDKVESELSKNFEDSSKAMPVQLFKVPHYLLQDPDKYIAFERSLDRYLILSDEQEELLATKDRAFLVQGPAGSGKTTLALFNALKLYEENSTDSIYLFTYHEELACVCRAYKVNLIGEEEDDEESESGIKVFSYIDFCRMYLRQSLDKKEREQSWISKKQSIEIFRQIISQKSRWQRNFSPEDLWGLVYSILKGRFMPGTESLPASKEDYERIFKDYGRMPEALEETLEIFAQYQSRLERMKQLDEADIIRLSYESLRKKAFLSQTDRRFWIVIDEVQDFTELEWKSILLFWENHCKHQKGGPSYPFLSGDTNQNISRSGFRWQELETYLQGILRNMHRPNALKMVTLHQNYRNTLQIHKLAAFIRKFGSDSSDLGLPPELEGERPRLIISTDDELLAFLKEKSSQKDLNNPIVVLVENDESLNFLRKELNESQSVFILSLRNSKGMEFEDVIIHRAFSSCTGSAAGAEASRYFDLWYMGISRARKNLLLVQTAADRAALKSLLCERDSELRDLLEIDDAKNGFEKYWNNRELLTPNYNVIFLERKLAQDLWEIYLKENENASDKQPLSSYANQCKEKALSLWRRCLDYSSLGKALMHLENFSEAIPLLKRAGLKNEAATCMEAAAQFDLAAAQYEQLNMIGDAARCFQKSGKFLEAASLYEQDESWQLAAQNYQRADNFGKAAALFVQIKDFKTAGELYLLIKDKLEAARCFQNAQLFEKAMELYEELEHFDEAAEAARHSGRHQKSAELFLKAGRLEESARSYDKAQVSEEAAKLYEQVKDWSNAANAYERAGLIENAALMFEQAGEWKKALDYAVTLDMKLLQARCREKLKDYRIAADLYQESGAIAEAAYSLEKANDFAAAAELHQQSQNLAQAANCLAKIDRKFEAAKLYVVSGQIGQAYELLSAEKQTRSKSKTEAGLKELITWCAETKRVAAQAQLLELKKDYLNAAAKFKECMMIPRAAECLAKAGRQGEAGLLYKQSAELEKAAQCFKQAKQWQESAICFEQMGKWLEAKEMFERCNDKLGIARCNSALDWL